MKRKISSATSVTLLSTAVIFLLLTVTMLISNTLFFFLARQGWISVQPGTPRTPIPLPLLIQNGIVSILIGTILAVGIVHPPLRSVTALIQAIHQVSAGNFHTKIHLKHPKEFRELSRSFNQMTDELAGIEMLRSDFINNFSHEFKTPIVSILGFARLLKNQALTDGLREEYLDIIIDEARRLADLSSNVLNLSKVESISLLTDVSPYNVSEQIRRSVLLLENKWVEKNISFDLDLEELQIVNNEQLLKQVWMNLLDNAIKFSPENSKIFLSVTSEENNAVCVIQDHGIGMDEKTQRCIFDKFYQGDSSRRSAGNGLGLSLVKKIVELHHGEILVDSQPGKGSIFTVKLPLLPQ